MAHQSECATSQVELPYELEFKDLREVEQRSINTFEEMRTEHAQLLETAMILHLIIPS